MASTSTQDGGGSGHDISSDATENAPRPAKKARKRKTAAGGEQTTRRKRKGRLSVLPTLPLDILYEIFAHLGPGDLLHLARTTKSFRSILMTRQSAFIWKEVLDTSIEDGYPSRPADVTEPEWTALVFGRPWCTACGARTSSAIVWMLRVRLCAKCMTDQLRIVYLCTATIPHRDPNLRLHMVLPTECVNYPSHSQRSTRLMMVLKVKDLEFYKDALKDLREKYPDDALFQEQRKLFDEGMTSTTEARREHALECSNIEGAKAQSRGNELRDVRIERHAEIKRRLLALGYEVCDVDDHDVQKHKDVWAPRPLTERVWTNIEPSVRQCVENVRARRIKEGIARRRREREDFVGRAYLDFLRTIPHSTLSFMPSLANLIKLTLVSEAIAVDVSPSGDMLAPVTTALESSRPDIVSWMQRRAQRVRELLPGDWPRAAEATQALSVMSGTELALLVPGEAFKDLDLVAYTWNYPLGTGSLVSPGVIYGLDVIAQQNDPKDDLVGVKPSMDSHLAILQILALLGLDPTRTTVPQMHLLADLEFFVCESCVRAGDHMKHPHARIYLKSWKEAVAHAMACPSRITEGPPKFRLASSLERRFMLASRKADPPVGSAPENDQPRWGCCHCDFHLHKPATCRELYTKCHAHSTGPWRSLSSVKDHLRQTHGILDGVEVTDFFWDRQWARSLSSRGAYFPLFGLEEATEKLEREVS